MRKHDLEDEIHYRETEGYVDLTPAEIKELEVDKD
jgi:hypothetical protein